MGRFPVLFVDHRENLISFSLFLTLQETRKFIACCSSSSVSVGMLDGVLGPRFTRTTWAMCNYQMKLHASRNIYWHHDSCGHGSYWELNTFSSTISGLLIRMRLRRQKNGAVWLNRQFLGRTFLTKLELQARPFYPDVYTNWPSSRSQSGRILSKKQR
ncbi:hypothetical protein SODALDRAFT_96025 [Sodiomyces alkalinus F11]|uniref:Uncharacterized protein n=1 Tax=Sodiomyces alkalinus (strain CBS 110278 / VKM F-3762 / F11) TaxID=1314773 RepID=A0A3N2Q126_SODAK|nr:hypothetical protein SODALDRAFT_96025 [Sodiomyces alkalinus F11]ROT40416.1 hypothetical protein SODALDRAFT_96025 [Sodiomyces alkalinus F11]